jgi:hypothetical protein
MKEIKNHTATHLTEKNFTVTTTTANLAKVVPLAKRFEVAKNAPAQVTDENATIIRRHSFDDNGGGYQGL